MRRHRVASVAALMALTIAVAARAQTVEIPVVLPLTGSAAFLGQGERQALQILEKVVNAQPGTPVRFTFQDDQSSPQVAVQLAAQIKAQRPPIVLGSAIVAMCNAMAPVLQGGPVQYCLSPGVHPVPGSALFASFIATRDLAEVMVRYFRGRGFTRIAMITSTDATGQEARGAFEATMKLPENAGVTMAAAVQFNPSDVSVAGQIEQLKAAHAQAVVAWTTGSPFGTVLKGIAQGGLDLPIATTDANMTLAQMQQYAAFMPKEALFMSSEWPPHGPDVPIDPRVAAAQTPMFAAYAAAKVSPDMALTFAWDPGLLAVAALRSLGRDATPEQIRSFIAGTNDWAGINGIYDFTRVPQRGLDQRDALVTRWDADKKTWVIVSKPGGASL